ncbi:peptidase inhibitor family I36 protein [Nonomuraea lactucae]|uniref:peptidase inhibitor family I36 protein n=1 Tax=Nonomuraea lactucae TaxID=2249762 RepID=UPI000DE42AD0|nr:peptidase inhibitor family I36 protein [Nonomuraea lactucae]
MKHHLAAILTATAAGLTLLATGGATAASAAPDPIQQKIDKVLAEHPGGTQTSKNTIAWQNGDVILTLAGQNAKGVQAAAAAPCPDGRFCLFNDANFGGDFVSFRDRLCDNRIINLPSFNFNDKTSSWANNTDFDVDVWSDIGAGGPRLFQMFTFTESAGLPKNLNDRASSLNCF